ncbi:uncharacterized protein LOC128392415 [Panonychus citri]|uniref:uncharacterized protein LOC128392415 n=1 Tax=Panonychus citri TaxID=50023 RepID=UPI002307AE5B|nr:uncharacterized protein LOC128392415 [Panonychus citri]
MPSKKTLEPLSARSAPRKVNPTSTSIPFSLSKDGGFKRPKDLAAGRSNDVQRAIGMAKYLQTRLKLCKLEEEMKKRQEYYTDKVTEIWTGNDELSDKIHGKKVSLAKLTSLKEKFDQLTIENNFIGDLNLKFTKLDKDLECLFQHIEGQTCNISLQGIDKTTLVKLNDICDAFSSLDVSASNEIASLAEEVSKLKCFIEESTKIQQDLDQLKSELNSANQELSSLEEVEKSI